MGQLTEEHRAKLDSIVAKMESSGESDDEIRAVVSDFKQKYSPLETHDARPGLMDTVKQAGRMALENSPLGNLPAALEGGKQAFRLAKDHPVETGAIVGGLAAAPFTGGMSVLPAMGMMGLASAGGAGYGMAEDALVNKHVNPTMTDDVKELGKQAAYGAGGEGLTRGVAGMFRIAGPKLRNTAVSAYERMLKPNKSTLEAMPKLGPTLESRSTAVAKHLIEDPNGQITKAGTNRYTDATGALQQKVDDIVAANPTARGKTSLMLDEVGPGRNRFANQWAPSHDTAAYDNVVEEGLQNPAIAKKAYQRTTKTTQDILGNFQQEPVTVQNGTKLRRLTRADDARKMTQGTYRNLGDAAYGELKGAQIEGHKALARGGRAILNDAIPAVEPINNTIANRIDMGQVLDEAVFRSGKHDPIGLRDAVVMANHPTLIPASLINRPGIGSPIARGLYQTGQKMQGVQGTNMLRAALAARLAMLRGEKAQEPSE